MKFTLVNLLILFLLAPVYADDNAANAGKALWKPEVGDFWVFEVVIDLPKDTKISKLEQFDDKRQVTYKETSVYRGLVPKIKEGVEVHAFDVLQGDELQEIEYVTIEDDAIEVVGSKKEGKTPKNAIIMGKPILLMSADWKGGESFAFEIGQPVAGGKISHKKQFRILGWETVETKAGTFKAMHVQIMGKSGPMETNSNYWFAPGTGFIKEVNKSYIAEKVIYTETKVLEQTGKQELEKAPEKK